MSHVWDELLTDTDKAVIRNGKYGNARGLGQHPALLIIDCQYLYIGEDGPIAEQQARYPAGGGAAAWAAVRMLRTVLDQARRTEIPVFFTRKVQKKTVKFDSFARKSGWDHTRNL
ncbi:MAG: hypothetical protein KGJ86_16975, partial [Chloroflexota bacterium]|nr:hypothetical protein [Chloroflexota bacterium]